MACEEARRLGADKLYISAHSSKESQAAYRALGCPNGIQIIKEQGVSYHGRTVFNIDGRSG